MENESDVRRGEEQPTKTRKRDRRHATCVIANETRDFRASWLVTPWHVTNQPMKICEKIGIYLCLRQDQSASASGQSSSTPKPVLGIAIGLGRTSSSGHTKLA